MDHSQLRLCDRIRLVPVSPGDFDQLVAIRIAAMRDSLERLGRFDPARARQRLADSFVPEQTRWIRFDDVPVGFVAVRPEATALHLDHLYIVPQAQGQGVGGFVLQLVIAEAEKARLPLHLGALRGSDSNRFYQRHGFEVVGEDTWDIYYVRTCS